MLEGRVDDVRDGVVYGWAADPERPGERVTIEINAAGRRIASGLADLDRVDLRDAGLGDGRHAFAIRLPEDRPGGDGLAVTASLPGAEPLALPVAAPDERHLERLFDIFAGRWSAELGGLREEAARLRASLGRLRDGDVIADIEATLGRMERRLEEVERRTEEADVFLVRLDGALRKLDEERRAARRPGLFARIFRGAA